MGVAQMESGAVPVNVTIYTLTFNEEWTEGEMTTAYAMQDVVNEIIEALAPEKKTEESAESVIIQQSESQETVNYIEIITAYHTLYYPGRWKSILRTEHLELQDENMYKVHFYGRLENREEQLLFSIYFGGDEGEQLGAVMGPDGIPVPVNILMAELDVTDLTESEQETLYSMQEASNELIQMIDYID